MELTRLHEAQPLLRSSTISRATSSLPTAIILAAAISVSAAIGWNYFSKQHPKSDPITNADPNIILTDPEGNLELRCYLEKFCQQCLDVFDGRWMHEMCGEYEDDLKFSNTIVTTSLFRDAKVFAPRGLRGIVSWKCLKDEKTGQNFVQQSVNSAVLEALSPEKRSQVIVRDENPSKPNPKLNPERNDDEDDMSSSFPEDFEEDF